MSFNWELAEFSKTSRHKCHILHDDYLLQVFTLKPRIARKELLAKTELFIRNTKKVGRGWHKVE